MKLKIILLQRLEITTIASFATATGAPVGIMSTSCSPEFSVTTGFVKKF